MFMCNSVNTLPISLLLGHNQFLFILKAKAFLSLCAASLLISGLNKLLSSFRRKARFFIQSSLFMSACVHTSKYGPPSLAAPAQKCSFYSSVNHGLFFFFVNVFSRFLFAEHSSAKISFSTESAEEDSWSSCHCSAKCRNALPASRHAVRRSVWRDYLNLPLLWHYEDG